MLNCLCYSVISPELQKTPFSFYLKCCSKTLIGISSKSSSMDTVAEILVAVEFHKGLLSIL